MPPPTSEFELIERFTACFDRGRRPLVSLGIGDDAALLRLPGLTAATTDAIVEGVHFSHRFTPEEVGYKALAVNLSDLAAMGAKPEVFLCSIALPRRWVARIERVGRGMAELASHHGCTLVGGNVTQAPQLAITIAALGKADHPLTRAGARPGDLLVVSGALGGAAAGLRAGAARHLIQRQRRPEPQIQLGRAVAPWCSAAIDVSDGMIQDLRHLLKASGVGAEVDPRAVPIAPGATLEQALGGGEDYELVLAVPPRNLARVRRAGAALEVPLTAIGRCSSTRGLRLPGVGAVPGGFDHLERDRRRGR